MIIVLEVKNQLIKLNKKKLRLICTGERDHPIQLSIVVEILLNFMAFDFGNQKLEVFFHDFIVIYIELFDYALSSNQFIIF